MSKSKLVEVLYGPRGVQTTTFATPDLNYFNGVQVLWDASSPQYLGEDAARLLATLDIEIFPLDEGSVTPEGLRAMVAASNQMIDRIINEDYQPDLV